MLKLSFRQGRQVNQGLPCYLESAPIANILPKGKVGKHTASISEIPFSWAQTPTFRSESRAVGPKEKNIYLYATTISLNSLSLYLSTISLQLSPQLRQALTETCLQHSFKVSLGGSSSMCKVWKPNYEQTQLIHWIESMSIKIKDSKFHCMCQMIPKNCCCK